MPPIKRNVDRNAIQEALRRTLKGSAVVVSCVSLGLRGRDNGLGRRLPALTRRHLSACSCRRENPPLRRRRLLIKETWGSRLGVSPAPHLAFRIITSFKGFFFLLCHPALCLFAPSTGFFLLFCAQLAHLLCGGVVLGRVGTHRWWPPSHTQATPSAS